MVSASQCKYPCKIVSKTKSRSDIKKWYPIHSLPPLRCSPEKQCGRVVGVVFNSSAPLVRLLAGKISSLGSLNIPRSCSMVEFFMDWVRVFVILAAIFVVLITVSTSPGLSYACNKSRSDLPFVGLCGDNRLIYMRIV